MANIKEVLVSMDYGPAPEANDHVKAWLAGHRERHASLHRRRLRAFC